MSSEQDRYQLHQSYDSDWDSSNRTPPLEAVHPNYIPAESPRPQVECSSSSASDESDQDKSPTSPPRTKRRKGQTQASPSDGVLIRSWAPNHPELARDAEQHALESGSESEAEEGEEEPEDLQGHQDNTNDSQSMRSPVSSFNNAVPSAATQEGSGFHPDVKLEERHHHASDWPPAKGQGRPACKLPGIKSEQQEGTTTQLSHIPDRPAQTCWNVLPPPRPRVTDTPLPDRDLESERENSFMSPSLSRDAFSPSSDIPEDLRLPALKRSPSQHSQARSSESKQTLPSIRTTLSLDSGPSPGPGMPSPLPIKYSPSPYSQTPTSYSHSPRPIMSPPAPPSQFNWRSSTRDSSTSGTSEYNSGASAAASTPASIHGQSPAASYTLPLSTLPEQDASKPQIEHLVITVSDPEKSATESAPFSTTPYVCTFPGCNALPFQTQYLLNSHMNVHSNDRPHFCPVENCARGVGGKGFKRKNEMTRHGLVHTSPGYICPFCADQQHRYPRPDNLQRHVRVHHLDRDRDDPLLRHVLNQRPEGGNKGRRRRIGTM